MKFTNQVVEQLPPSQIIAQLQKRIEQLELLLEIKEKALKKAPKGSLRVSKSHGAVQYYQKINKDDKNGHYLDSAHKELTQKLAQKAYNIKLVPEIQKEIDVLQNAITQLQKILQGRQVSLRVLECINPDCRALVVPATLSDAQYAAAWLETKYKGKPFQPDAKPLYTSGGQRVRSKSEVIIAEALARLDIPFRYEFPLKLQKGGGRHGTFTVYPDFLCLNLRTRQEFIWEHFGLMDDPEYSEKFVQKIHTYGENGILPGKNLIFTTETEKEQLDTRNVEDLIKIFLK